MIAPAIAQALPGERPLELLLLLGALALAPLALVTLTSFLKVVVVLSVLRSALGAPQVPPNAAVTGLALLVTLLVMQPVAEACWARWQDGAAAARARRRPSPRPPAAAEPLRPSSPASPRRPTGAPSPTWRRGRGEAPPRPAGEEASRVLAPAFVVSELRRAFTIGFLVFLPFLVVDLAVANVLLSLGLTQLSPTAVALPFKLLLLVAVDGFGLLARGLAAGYLR